MTRQIRRSILARFPALVTVLALMCGSARPQATEKSTVVSPLSTAEVRALFPAESIPFSAAPPLMLLTETKCDLKGNLYLIQSGSPSSLLGQSGLSTTPVSKLSTSSKSVTTFPVPNLDRYRGVVRSDFDASADGHVYSLLAALDASETQSQLPSFFIARYGDDGSVDSYFKLGEAPEGRIQPSRFAMFRGGNVLVTGTVVTNEPPLRPFTAVFDRSGTFVTYVKTRVPRRDAEDRQAPTRPAVAEPLPTESSSAAGKHSPEQSPDASAVSLSSSSFMVSASDGNVYLLQSSGQLRLHIISPSGEILRDFELSPPAPGLTATNMGMAGDDSVFISFGRVQGLSGRVADSDGPSNLISVINPRTGEGSAVYRLTGEAEAFDVPGCAASYYNFLFVGATADHQHLQVTRYLPR